MKMLIDEAIDYLDRHINRRLTLEKIDGLSLEHMVSLLEAIGDPQRDFPMIHVTGTNGKGSTAAMISGLLNSLGLTVGTYSSPHVSSITERIQIRKEPISEEDFAEAVSVLSLVELDLGFSPSWFELVTAAAFRCFADSAVDVAVVEVGMLGRFDATNVGDPVVSVITNIGYDHTDGEEGWQRKLAWEKAGIIRETGDLCLGAIDDELDDIFTAENPKQIYRRDNDFLCEENELALGGRQLTLRSQTEVYENLFLPLHGEHQGNNASIALSAAEAFVGAALPYEVVQSGLEDIYLPARFEILRNSPLLIVDGAHNPPGAEAALTTLEKSFRIDGKRILIIGMTQEKNAEWMTDCLKVDEADLVICTQAVAQRAMPADVLANVIQHVASDVKICKNPKDALEFAMSEAEDQDVILGTGSLYVAGAIRDAYLAST